MNSLEILPASTLQLANETLHELRANPTASYESLTDAQQAKYDLLAAACLQDIIERPDTANLLTKLVPTEEAYSIKLADIDKALLRVHFYAPEGASDIDPRIMQEGIVDSARFGTPHTHYGNISSAVPLGRLVHYCFTETEGQDYTASHITYRKATDTTGTHRQAVVTPHHSASLAFNGTLECDKSHGYRMDRSAIHVISWPEPTVTVFFSDMIDPKRTVAYQPFGTPEIVSEPRSPLGGAEQERVWESFNDVLRSCL